MMGRVETGFLWYDLLCNTFDWPRYVLPVAPKLAIVGSGQGLKREIHQ